MSAGPRTDGPDGLLVLDKPAGMTSHDVVSAVRRLARTRKVGHAGTLDPMATGLLVLGLGRATRLLGHVSDETKGYDATIRLGRSTSTDDADGEPVGGSSPELVTDSDLAAAITALTGDIVQVPSSVSAIKVDGKRAYALVRAGESVDLASRPVTVSQFTVLAQRRSDHVLDVDVHVECSTGTYIRALARDLGTALRVGGHLTSLRRTRVGTWSLADAVPLADLEAQPDTVPALVDLATALRRGFPALEVDEDVTARIYFGAVAALPVHEGDPVAVFAPDGRPLALVQRREGKVRALAVFVAPERVLAG